MASNLKSPRALIRVLAAVAVALALVSCGERSETKFIGYIEGDFVRPAPIAPGRMVALAVQRGDRVAAGDLLFALDDEQERARHDLAAATLAQAEAQLANLETGRRPEEIAVIRAEKVQAEARLALAALTLNRQEKLLARKVVSVEARDQAEAEYRAASAAVGQQTAALAVAELPARADEIKAAAAAVAVAGAALRDAAWQLKERRIVAVTDGTIQDTFFRSGEFIAAAAPVLSYLPDANIFVKFYVPEAALPRIAPGVKLRVTCDGCSGPVAATVRFVAREVEFTPPVLYAESTRTKLMFRVEASLATTAELHPGLPVDVALAAD